jgi:hypothetical protein
MGWQRVWLQAANDNDVELSFASRRLDVPSAVSTATRHRLVGMHPVKR